MRTGVAHGTGTKPERGLGITAQRVCGALLLAVGAVAVLAPRNTWFVFDHGVVLVTVVPTLLLLVGGVVLARRSGPRGGDGTWLGWAGGEGASLVGAGLAVVAAWVYGVSAAIRFGWDATIIVRAAHQLAEGGDLAKTHVDYFARFPNNVPLLALETGIVRVGQALGMAPLDALLAWQALLVGVTVWCLGRTARLLGQHRRGVVIQVAALVLVGLSPQVAVPYTDIPAVACVAVAVLATAAAMHARRTEVRLVLLTLGVVVVALGCSIKPYVGVVSIAGALVVLAGASSWRRLVAVLAGTAVAALLTVGTIRAVDTISGAATGLTTQRLTQVREPFPPELWLAAGTYDSQEDSPVRRYGGYNQAMVDKAAAFPDEAERKAVLRAQILTNLERPLGQNLGFFGAEVAWVWGDGTFWASGEGLDGRQPAAHQDGALGALAEWTTATGQHYLLKASLVEGAWVGGLLFLGGVLVVGGYDRWRTGASLALLGFTAYQIFFEGRPRYLLALVPVVLVTVLTSTRPDAT